MGKSSYHQFCVTGIPAAFLAILITFSPSIRADDAGRETTGPGQSEVKAPDVLRPSPAADNSTNNLNNIHDGIFLRLQRSIRRVNKFFAKDKENDLPTPVSRLRVGLYAMLKDEDAFSARFEPKVDIEVRLPNLEKRWSIFIDSMRNDDLPDTDPTERKSSLNTGFRRAYDDWKLHADVGVRWRSGPAGMARMEWRPDFSIGKVRFYPREKVFYESWEGLGEMTSLTVNRSIGRNFARLVSGAKWTQSTDGLEWEQTFIFGRVIKLIEEQKPCDLVADDDVAKGVSLRYSIFGHNSARDYVIDRHRVTLVYRRPMFRDWIFLQIAPGIEWLDESDWKSIPSIQIGFDTLFWEVTKK